MNIIYIFSIIGILDTIYLIYNKINNTNVACPFFPKEWCYKVQHSKYSKTFGIPNSILGLIMYIAILIMTIAYSMGLLSIIPIIFIICFGLLFSFYFLYIQKYILKAYCTWCVLSFINFLMMFIALFFI